MSSDTARLEQLLDGLHEGFDKSFTWGGRPIWKNPVDLLVYQEIARDVEPTLVIETGTHLGGSAEFWMDIMRGNGRVVTVDVDQRCKWPPGAGVVALKGESTDPDVVAAVARRVRPDDRVIVNLDSLHTADYVLHEMDVYAALVTAGSYLIVEDGIDEARGRGGPPGSGVLTACREWSKQHPEFKVDHHRERSGVSNNPHGFLRRIA